MTETDKSEMHKRNQKGKRHTIDKKKRNKHEI